MATNVSAPRPAGGADVVVAGGGAIGLAIAWAAARRGMSVRLVDPQPARGSSWAAAGMLAPVTEAHYGETPLLRLALESSRRYPAFVERLERETGMDVGYRPTGTLMVARDADDNAAIEQLYRFQSRCGLEVDRLTSVGCRDLEPALSPRIRGGSFVRSDHAVDNRALCEALMEACRSSGVVVQRRALERVVVRDDRVTAATLDDGTEVTCEHVVLAAGCWSGDIAGIPEHALLPVRPVKGQLLYLGAPGASPVLTRNVRGLEVYIVPRSDGRIVVGATVEEMGFDLRFTAGAAFALLRAAYELVPGILELELLETVVGLRPGSPDNAPLLGDTGVRGLVAATGHHRNGILLTPVTADCIAELLETGATPALIETFRPARFDRTGVAV